MSLARHNLTSSTANDYAWDSNHTISYAEWKSHRLEIREHYNFTIATSTGLAGF